MLGMQPARSGRRPAAVAVLALLVTAPPGVAETARWLPDFAVENAARDLVGRLERIEKPPELGPEEQLEAARQTVLEIAERLEAWGPETVLERSPSVRAIEVPSTEDPILAALAAWGACSLAMDLDFAETPEQIFEAALGGLSVGIVTAYLLPRYAASGGDGETLKEYLASDAMNALSLRVYEEPDLRATLSEECAPAFDALLYE